MQVYNEVDWVHSISVLHANGNTFTAKSNTKNNDNGRLAYRMMQEEGEF